MSNGQLIYLMVAIAVILILAYVTAIFLRKRNVSRLTALEERKNSTTSQLMTRLKPLKTCT